ncbi:MAG TPA: dephospho-CoA kinase [Kiritimatiellia bacterium]|nr:dephospho-CoA kinase [Kiritimatiellia bacterium]
MMSGAIGLTGGFGCGKSEVAGMLRAGGIPVLDTDAMAHELLAPGHWVFEKIVHEFGRDYMNEEGGINRRKLGRYIFEDDAAREKLNRIMHPVILADMELWLNDELTRHAHAVAMVPLLFETGSDAIMNKCLVVAADDPLIYARLRQRGWTDVEISARIRSQLPVQEKIRRADGVIWNNEDLSSLRKRTWDTWNKIVLGKENET